MGNQTPQKRQESQWQWIENQNGVEIYRSKIDGRLAERRRIIIPSSFTLAQQNKVYAFRANNNFGLVKSYEAIRVQDFAKKEEHFADLCKCSNEQIQIDVFTERIAYRLSELPQLTFPEGLQFLRQTATAFEVAYQKVGGLHINPELIGLNEKGEIRAWVNENWAINRPSHYIPILKSSSQKQEFGGIIPELRDESQMINNLIAVIQEKTQHGQFPNPFSELLKAKSSNFRSLRKFLGEFISNNNISLPNTISKDKVVTSSRESFETDLPVASQPNRPNFVGQIASLPQFSYNSYNNSLPKESNYRQFSIGLQSNYRNNYARDSTFQPTITTNPYKSELPPFKKEEFQSTSFSTYKPYVPQYKFQSPSYLSNLSQPLNSSLRFNLLPSIDTNKPTFGQRPLDSNMISRPESPLFALNRLIEKDAEGNQHNSAYQVLSEHPNSIST